MWRRNAEAKQLGALSPAARGGFVTSRSELLQTATPSSAANSQQITAATQIAKISTPMRKAEKIVRDPKTGKGTPKRLLVKAFNIVS